MRYMVTGAAGFIGSHLCEALLQDGAEVVGIDAFIPYYPRSIKEGNLATLLRSPAFSFHELDLRDADLTGVLAGVEVIFHIAAMPGLLASWSKFDLYTTCNLQATQRLLQAACATGQVRQFIHGSTSSIYGSYVVGDEQTKPQPVSPYGITKLAAEHLVQVYSAQFGLPSSILRYFSVYGPRQRPDMGYHIFIESILQGRPITVFGSGDQLRGSTYVSDVIRATLLAHERFQPGTIYNIGGSDEVSANQTLRLLEDIIGKKAIIQFGPARPGEQSRALADMTLARERLGFVPETPMRAGLEAQVAWQRQLAVVR